MTAKEVVIMQWTMQPKGRSATKFALSKNETRMKKPCDSKLHLKTFKHFATTV
jgi:hypothetical protein